MQKSVIRNQLSEFSHQKSVNRFVKFIFNRILNSEYRIPNSGFTLIELLIVLTLMGVIGSITAQVFILGTRSQAKTEVLKEVKQNGDYIEYVVENMIRNAVDIDPSMECYNTSNNASSRIKILNPDGNTTTFECDDTTGKMASVSGLTQQYLSNDKVRVSDCSFRVICPTPPIAPKYVFFTYTICKNTGSEQTECIKNPDDAMENRTILDYQTTVSLRNYQ
jgi:prepilin-type N-terminal cleavage/methylation domain-containing protein